MTDNSERRSRLVTLVYRVLQKFTTPPDGEKESYTYSHLASAFHRQAAQSLDDEDAANHKAAEDKRDDRADSDTRERYIGKRGNGQDSADS